MMLAQKPPRLTARPYTFPVATGGWNASSALDAMPPNEAETLINWFPETTYLRLRRGFTSYTDTGTAAAVTSLAVYSSGTDDALLAYSDGAWYDVTGGTATSLASASGSGYFDWTNYATAAGQYLIVTNGSVAPLVYDGTNMVAAVNTIGGVAPTIYFSSVCAYNQRIYYAEADSLSLWYLAAGTYQGALTEYDLGSLAVHGGKIAAIETWTRDNAAAGANEMLVAVTTEGEVFVFTGLYPGAGAWALSARFVVGRPVSGPNCLIRIGPDLVLLCEDGFQPLGQYLQFGQSQAQRVALSKKIGNAVTQAVKTYSASAGWDAVLYPQGNMMIFNIPQTTGVFVQYAVNTLTGAWCQWSGQNAYCWAVFDGAPYFGAADGVVYRADSGTNDNGASITGEYRGSYQYVGGRGLLKRMTMAQPIFSTTGPVTTNFSIDVDFVNGTLTSPITSSSSGGVWGTGVWGVMTWGGATALQRNWLSVSGIGYAIAPHFLVTTSTISMQLMSINLTYERGLFL